MKLIDSEAFKKEINQSKNLGLYDIQEVCNMIDNFPESRTPSGEWLVKNQGTTHYYYCSICGNSGDFFDKFCRNCGAEMEGLKSK